MWTAGGVICDAHIDEHGYTQADPSVLKRHMEQLANDPELRAHLGAAGRRAWQERFTWERIIRLYEEVLEECLQRKAVA
jgi:glycosyltransferase involved in cell wall biosynthesis